MAATSASLRVCPCTPRPRHEVSAVRDVRGQGLDHVQRDTTSDGTLACGHSRSEYQRSRSFRGSGHRAIPVTRVRIPHAITRHKSLRRACASKAEIGRDDWAAPEPVTGWNTPRWLSGVRAPVYETGGRTFDPCTRYQDIARALVVGRSSRAELRVVTPPVPVRIRAVNPERMCGRQASLSAPGWGSASPDALPGASQPHEEQHASASADAFQSLLRKTNRSQARGWGASPPRRWVASGSVCRRGPCRIVGSSRCRVIKGAPRVPGSTPG